MLGLNSADSETELGEPSIVIRYKNRSLYEFRPQNGGFVVWPLKEKMPIP